MKMTTTAGKLFYGCGYNVSKGLHKWRSLYELYIERCDDDKRSSSSTFACSPANTYLDSPNSTKTLNRI